MRSVFKTLTAALAVVISASMSQAVTISNTATGIPIGPFGQPITNTYGQVFVAPVTGTLDSFTFWLNGGVGDLRGAVGTWSGSATFALGQGLTSTLYTSDLVASGAGGAQTFAPGVSVTEGDVYVAFLTVFGAGLPATRTTMPRADALPGGGYFVFNNNANGGNPFGATQWDYFSDFGNVLFSASFTPMVPIPLPAAGWLMLAGLGGLAAMRRRKRT